MPPFGEKLSLAVFRKCNPVVVGLDPRLDALPENLRPADHSDRTQVAESYQIFCCDVIDAVASLVPAVKPQSAFFEQLGPPGCQALADVIQYATQRELLVILDGKRNDIGSTAEAYADAYLGRDSAWGADALTVSPYLGEDTLLPFVDACHSRDAGIFVLVKTSNAGSGFLQDQIVDGQPLYRKMAQAVEQLSAAKLGPQDMGSVGAVVGATYPEQLAELRQAMPHCWLLVPGYGSQGGTARDVVHAFDDAGGGAVINSSRAIIFAHRRPEYATRFGENQWQRAVEEATRDMIAELQAETGGPRGAN